MWIVIAIPFLIVACAVVYLLYKRIVHPKPVALGSQIRKFGLVSKKDIDEYCARGKKSDTNIPLPWRLRQWRQFRVGNTYIAQMSRNTLLLQQTAAFEVLRIDPRKLGSDYDARETIVLQLVEDAVQVRWLLIKGQLEFARQTLFGKERRDLAIEKLQHLLREYKHLEIDAVLWVRMSKEKCYYHMMLERFGLTDWNL